MHYFASKNIKIAYNFNEFFRNRHFLFIFDFWLIFPIRKISKNNNFKVKTLKSQMKHVYGQI